MDERAGMSVMPSGLTLLLQGEDLPNVTFIKSEVDVGMRSLKASRALCHAVSLAAGRASGRYLYYVGIA